MKTSIALKTRGVLDGSLLLLIICTVLSAQALAAQFKLPVEVLGAEGTIKSKTFTLSERQVRQAEKLYFFVNNLSYQNKGSIRINSGGWIDLNHTDINVYDKEMAYGGMQHGGMSSIRFTMPSDDLVAGDNTIKFRFNTSDGISIGYRVFRFNLLDENDETILPDSFFSHDDPNNWRAPRGHRNNQSVAEGKDLWYNAELIGHYLPDGRVATWYGNKLMAQDKMKANCSDCHTQDGRDLAYFSYSNNSIIERSKFHGLTTEEGKKIAAYIRSLDVPSHGRPWNPPYQPGPSVGEKSIEYWAAGAGIDAVLENDEEMLPYMFPNGTSQKEIDAYFDSDKMHDTTTVPISVQFPDWKRWLPLIHPKDAFGDFYAIENEDGTYSPGHAYHKHNPFVSYAAVREFLEQNDHDAIVENRDEFYDVMGDFWGSFRQFFTSRHGKKSGAHWRTVDSLANDYMPSQEAGFGQLTRTSLARLMAVKFFEFHQEFKLEQITQRLIPAEEQPAPRQWFHAMGYNVFEVPPHFTANAFGSNASFEGQPWATGIYETTTWYELQLIINPGNGHAGGTGPVDFNYHPGFIRKVSSIKGRMHPLRYYRAMNNVYQVKADVPSKRRGFRLRQQGLRNILPWGAKSWDNYELTRSLDELAPRLTVKVLNGMISQLGEALHKPNNHSDTFDRSENSGDFVLDPVSKSEYDENGSGYADIFYRKILTLKEFGVKPARINRVIDWCETAWPNMDWQAIRP